MLEACYFCLHREAFRHEVRRREHSRIFCILLSALTSTTPEPRWRLKPKVHQMQELREMCTENPSNNWTYRDEDFGGTMAAMARVRGGKGSARVVGRNVLLRFIAKNPLPRMR